MKLFGTFYYKLSTKIYINILIKLTKYLKNCIILSKKLISGVKPCRGLTKKIIIST